MKWYENEGLMIPLIAIFVFTCIIIGAILAEKTMLLH